MDQSNQMRIFSFTNHQKIINRECRQQITIVRVKTPTMQYLHHEQKKERSFLPNQKQTQKYWKSKPICPIGAKGNYIKINFRQNIHSTDSYLLGKSFEFTELFDFACKMDEKQGR